VRASAAAKLVLVLVLEDANIELYACSQFRKLFVEDIS